MILIYWAKIQITVKKNAEILLDTGKEVSLEINACKTKYRFMSHQYAGQEHNLNTANKFCENLARFKCLATTLTNQNCVHEETETRLNSGN
jgi:hypothetical protein